jgi:hypothetical protein
MMQTPSAHSAADVQARLAAEVALPSRLRYTALLLVSVGMTAVAGSLLATEAGLPTRTRIALAVVTAIAGCWAAYAIWVLARRRVLFARQRVVAGWMAVVFSALFTGGRAALAWSSAGGRAWLAATAVGITMLAIALVILVRARHQVATLLRRRAELEQRLVNRTVSP